jgi:hypothetical protein
VVVEEEDDVALDEYGASHSKARLRALVAREHRFSSVGDAMQPWSSAGAADAASKADGGAEDTGVHYAEGDQTASPVPNMMTLSGVRKPIVSISEGLPPVQTSQTLTHSASAPLLSVGQLGAIADTHGGALSSPIQGNGAFQHQRSPIGVVKQRVRRLRAATRDASRKNLLASYASQMQYVYVSPTTFQSTQRPTRVMDPDIYEEETRQQMDADARRAYQREYTESRMLAKRYRGFVGKPFEFMERRYSPPRTSASLALSYDMSASMAGRAHNIVKYAKFLKTAKQKKYTMKSAELKAREMRMLRKQAVRGMNKYLQGMHVSVCVCVAGVYEICHCIPITHRNIYKCTPITLHYTYYTTLHYSTLYYRLPGAAGSGGHHTR